MVSVGRAPRLDPEFIGTIAKLGGIGCVYHLADWAQLGKCSVLVSELQEPNWPSRRLAESLADVLRRLAGRERLCGKANSSTSLLNAAQRNRRIHG